MTPQKIQLNATEAIEAATFMNNLDATAEGFRQGIEHAKRIFIQALLEKRKSEQPKEPDNG